MNEKRSCPQESSTYWGDEHICWLAFVCHPLPRSILYVSLPPSMSSEFSLYELCLRGTLELHGFGLSSANGGHCFGVAALAVPYIPILFSKVLALTEVLYPVIHFLSSAHFCKWPLHKIILTISSKCTFCFLFPDLDRFDM